MAQWILKDIVGELELDKTLRLADIDELIENLNKEVWYRLLHEELPKRVPPAQFQDFRKRNILTTSLEALVADINITWPHIQVDTLLLKLIGTVKKEFMESYRAL